MSRPDLGHRHPRKRGSVIALLVVLLTAASGCAGQSTDSSAIDRGARAVTAWPAPDSSNGAGPASAEPSMASTAAPTVAAPLETVETVIPPPMVAAAPMPGSRPVRLQIPALDVDTGLLDLGLRDDGTLEVPPDAASVGWYTGGPSPGALGPAVIVGHVDWDGELGAFYYLKDLNIRDEITVTRADGTRARFRVTSNQELPKDQFPTEAVYGNIDHAGLRLITCGGEFDRQARSYTDNIIVFADLIDPSA